MYQIIFYVPESHCERVKLALFDAGAGRIGHYQQCAWQTLGSGQFRPLKNSNAFIGQVGKLQKVPELRVELVCEKVFIKPALQALIETHPYETPAYGVFDVKILADF